MKRIQYTNLDFEGELKVQAVTASGILENGVIEYDEREQTLVLGTMTGNKCFVSLEKFNALEQRVQQLESNN